jgi:hypothetical protein
MYLQESFVQDRTWFSASPVVTPSFFQERARTKAPGADRAAAARRLGRIRRVRDRYALAADSGRRALHQVAAWVIARWQAQDPAMLQPR